MRFKYYVKDKIYEIFIFLMTTGLVLLTFLAFKLDNSIIIVTLFMYTLCFMSMFLIDFFRKRNFYTNLIKNIEGLDKAYLVLETTHKPSFYEGKLLYQAFYEINKSMLENVNKINTSKRDFKEYVEMWIHEVKIPLSSLELTINNRSDKTLKKMKTQIKRLEDYVEQVLYYVRSENAEKDFFIKEVNISDVVKNIGLRNMDDLLNNKVDFRVEDVCVSVLTDSKWLEFILGQIVNNSIKYKSNSGDDYIKIFIKQEKNKVTLVIEDNGIGIKESDIRNVFNKSFTGENGRGVSYSTGMGLFIAKNMCEKLGHKISIESEYHKYTRVSISFFHNNYYNPIR